ncbi:MAG: PAS domain S-box protein [Pseudomonadota bacterium]
MIKPLRSAIAQAPSRRAQFDQLTRVEAVKLKVERAALLFRGAPTAIGVTLLNAAITAWVAWSAVNHTVLFAWLGAVGVVAAIRGGLWVRFWGSRTSARAMSQFANTHLFFMALNGALWGALAPIFAVYGLLSHAFLPFIIAGMSAAAVVSAGASWRAVLSFNVPALAPLAATYAIAAGEGGLAISAVVILFGAATAYLALTVQRMIDRSILLHTHNTALYDALQRQADEAHEAEQRFRALVESTQDLTMIFSPEGRVIYASPSAENIFGAPPDALVGRSTRAIVHEDDIPHFRAVGEKALSQLGESMELSHVCMRAPDGEYVALSGRLTNMLYVPGVEGFVFNGAAIKEAPQTHLHAVT